MTSFWQLNLIHLFDFYLATVFLLGTYRRLGHYRAVGRLMVSAGRWPRLLQLAKQHSVVFFTWSTALPALLALTLCVVQILASRLIWPEAGRPPFGLTIGRLADIWPAIPFVLVFGTAMFAMDVYGILFVGQLDRRQVESHFDQAEYWLRSWNGPMIRLFTLGRINPRQIVAVEVRNALHQLNKLLHSTLWWISTQLGLRIVFGLSLWLTYALNRG